MIYTVISDIHANLPALETLLKIAPKDCPFVCLGDVVGYGGSPAECLERVRSLASIVLQGNHERMVVDPRSRLYANPHARHAIEWTESVLDDESKSFLKTLKPAAALDKDILLVHGSPRHADEYIVDRNTIRDAFYTLEEKGMRTVFFGHTHVPVLYDEDLKDLYCESRDIRLDPGKKYLINPGSIGQPRDRDPRGSFCTFDTDKCVVRFERFEYDIELASRTILSCGLPSALATRLYYGM